MVPAAAEVCVIWSLRQLWSDLARHQLFPITHRKAGLGTGRLRGACVPLASLVCDASTTNEGALYVCVCVCVCSEVYYCDDCASLRWITQIDDAIEAVYCPCCMEVLSKAEGQVGATVLLPQFLLLSFWIGFRFNRIEWETISSSRKTVATIRTLTSTFTRPPPPPPTHPPPKHPHKTKYNNKQTHNTNSTKQIKASSPPNHRRLITS